MVEDQLSQMSALSPQKIVVHNTGIVGGVGGQFDAELLCRHLHGRSEQKMITAGGIFPNQTGFAGAVLLS